MQSFHAISLTKKLTYGFATALILSILTLGSILIYSSYRTQVNNIYAIQKERSLNITGNINTYITDLHQELSYLARVPGITELDEEIQYNLLEGIMRHNSAYENVGILNSEGQIEVEISLTNTSLFDNSQTSKAFTYTLNQRADFIGLIDFDAEQQYPYIFIAVPIRNALDKVDGVLLAKINLEYFWFILSQTHIGKTGYAYIIDQRQFLIARTGDNPRNFALKDMANASYLQNLLTSDKILDTYKGLTGQSVVGHVAQINIVNWHVIIELPTSEAYEPIKQMLIIMGTSLLGVLMTATGTGLYISSRLQQPLVKLIDAASQISAGKLDVHVNIKSQNELGHLASAFNIMSSNLSRTINDLQQDIKKRELVEVELRKSEARFGKLINSLPIIIFIYQESGIIYINPAVETITGYRVEDMLNNGFWSILDTQISDINAALGEIGVITKAGNLRHITLEVQPIEFDGQESILFKGRYLKK